MRSFANSINEALAEGVLGNKLLLPAPIEMKEGQVSTLANYVYYTLRWQIDANSNSFFSVQVYTDTAFDEEQRQHIVNSIQLWQSRQQANEGCVAARADRYLRDNSKPFNGRKYNASGLTDVRGRFGESIAINLAAYDALYIYDFNRDGRDDQDGLDYIKLYIDRFDQGANPDGSWKLGEAQINYYNGRELRIKLNGSAIGSGSAYQYRLDRLTWAAAIKHEVLHNLGWDHGNFGTDDFRKSWMVSYVECQFGTNLLLGEQM